MGFGGRIRERREELGLSRGKLAAMVGVTVSAIGNYESGVSFPKEEILLRLFDCLETDPNTLFQDSFCKDSVILSQTERQLLEGYRGLSARGRESVRSVVDTLCAYRDEMESGPAEPEPRAERSRRAAAEEAAEEAAAAAAAP